MVLFPDDPTNKRPRNGAFLIRHPSSSVKQLLEKRFLSLGMAMLIAVSMWLSVARTAPLIILRLQKGGLLHRSCGWRILGASLDDLVEFSSIEPNTPALGAIVNFNTLSLTHHEGDTTDGTWHTGSAGHRGPPEAFKD